MRVSHGRHAIWSLTGFFATVPTMMASNPLTQGVGLVGLTYGATSVIDWQRDAKGEQPLAVKYIPGIE